MNKRRRDEIWRKIKHVRTRTHTHTHIHTYDFPFFNGIFFRKRHRAFPMKKGLPLLMAIRRSRGRCKFFHKISHSGRTFRSFVSFDFSYHEFLLNSSAIQNRSSVFPVSFYSTLSWFVKFAKTLIITFPRLDCFLKKKVDLYNLSMIIESVVSRFD